MSTQLKICIGLLVALFALIIVLDFNTAKPVDWRPTYSVNDKIPLGLFVFDKELDKIVDTEVTRFTVTPYEFLEQTYEYDDEENPNYGISGTIVDIAHANPIDDQSATELLYFVSYGNSVFLSMKTFPEVLLDSLKIKMGSGFNRGDSIAVHTNSAPEKEYYLSEDAGMSYFEEIDSANTAILGYQKTDSLRSNFIKVRYRNGDFYLHTQPAAFSNFYLLKDNNHEYVAQVLSYLPQQPVYLQASSSGEDSISNSKLRYIFSQPALAWAWYLFIFGMLFFMIFNAKRKQRIVPILMPLQNTTVEFAKTIGNLYYQEGDHNTIVDKKIIYFLEKIRIDYLIDTTKLDADFVRKLHQKSGKDIADIERVVQLINMHRKSYHSSVESDLIQINNAIEKIIH